jgi:hypothetical protein
LCLPGHGAHIIRSSENRLAREARTRAMLQTG